jgi:hypothetical protein
MSSIANVAGSWHTAGQFLGRLEVRGTVQRKRSTQHNMGPYRAGGSGSAHRPSKPVVAPSARVRGRWHPNVWRRPTYANEISRRTSFPASSRAW